MDQKPVAFGSESGLIWEKTLREAIWGRQCVRSLVQIAKSSKVMLPTETFKSILEELKQDYENESNKVASMLPKKLTVSLYKEHIVPSIQIIASTIVYIAELAIISHPDTLHLCGLSSDDDIDWILSTACYHSRINPQDVPSEVVRFPCPKWIRPHLAKP